MTVMVNVPDSKEIRALTRLFKAAEVAQEVLKDQDMDRIWSNVQSLFYSKIDNDSITESIVSAMTA